MESLEFSDYVAYWLKLFPELDSASELEEVLKRVSGTRLVDLHEKLEASGNSVDSFLSQLLTTPTMPILVKLGPKIKMRLPYYYFFEPILNLALSRYYHRLMNMLILAGDLAFWENTLIQLALSLYQVAERTIILEINVARIEDHLKGATPQERFIYFTDVVLRDKDYLTALYGEYTVLTELMRTKADNYLSFLLEILENTQAELDSITRGLNNETPFGKVCSIITGMGDTHCGGKTVSVISFDSGSKIVYKPRHTVVEEKFQLLLQWKMDRAKELLGDKILKIHSGNGCGWIEYVDYKESENADEVERFYIRIGQLMCMLYALNARDFHHENILAFGEYPILLDLESIFHSNQGLNSNDTCSALSMANCILERSVYSIGLLPQTISNPTDSYSDKSIDVSGLGGEDVQISPFQGMQVVDDNTDTIRMETQYGSIMPKSNAPKMHGFVQRSEWHIEGIKRGFTNMYRWLQCNKNELISLLHALFAGQHNRYILRPTFLYAQLLSTSYHPDFMRDPISRDVLLHRLGIGESGDNSEVLACELHDLRAGEVPFFNIVIDSTKLLDSRGACINGLLDKAPMEEVQDKIMEFCEEDLEQQLHFIDMSFAAKTSSSKKDSTGMCFATYCHIPRVTPAKWLDLATNIGELIIQRSISAGSEDLKEITWIDTILEGREEVTWSLAPVGNDLYNGNGGIALFLGYLGAIAGRKHFSQAAYQAIRVLQRAIEAVNVSHPYTIGAFNGLSGFFYTLSKLCSINHNAEVASFIKKYLKHWAGLLEKDKLFDVVGGSAGSLGVLLSMEQTVPGIDNRELFNMITTTYRHIAKSGRKSPLGVSWGMGNMAYSGFAHGNAGIAAYLAKYYARTGDKSALSSIEEALKLERALYSPEHKNWFPSLAKDRISHGWCHGAPGILLSKLIIAQYDCGDDFLKQELNVALETTVAKSFGYNTSLCHGDLGNLAILNYAAKILKDDNLGNLCTETFQNLFENVLLHRWNQGLFRGTESMGLMVGLAGIGYALLRQCEPDFVPEVLILE